MLQKNEFPSSGLCQGSAARDPQRGKGKISQRCSPSCIHALAVHLPLSLVVLVILGAFTNLFVCFPYETVANLLTQSYTSDCNVLFGPGPPVFVWTLYSQGTVPDRRTTALPELNTDMDRVQRVEPNSSSPPTLSGVPLHFQVRLWKESFLPLSPSRPSGCWIHSAKAGTRGPGVTQQGSQGGEHVQAPHNAGIVC